jgi:hypothetical protein
VEENGTGDVGEGGGGIAPGGRQLNAARHRGQETSSEHDRFCR